MDLGHGEHALLFLAWILPHGVPELTAINLCSAGGLALGRAVAAPGRRTRSEALRRAGPHALALAVASVPLFLAAAWIESFVREAASHGLVMANTLSFPSVVMNRDSPQLVQVKAVDDAYPLRGQLLLRNSPEAPVSGADSAPAPGSIWVEPRLLVLLDAVAGAPLSLGESRFTVERLIESEPDWGCNLFQLEPRVMLDLQDIPATGLVSVVSRLRHQLLVGCSI